MFGFWSTGIARMLDGHIADARFTEGSGGISDMYLHRRRRPDVVYLLEIGQNNREQGAAVMLARRLWPNARVLATVGALADGAKILVRAGAHRLDFGDGPPNCSIYDWAAGIIRETAFGDVSHPPHLLAEFERDLATFPHVESLTVEEYDTLLALSRLHREKEVASHLGYAYQTVRNRLTNVYRKLEVHGQLEAVVLGIRIGLLPEPRPTSS